MALPVPTKAPDTLCSAKRVVNWPTSIPGLAQQIYRPIDGDAF